MVVEIRAVEVEAILPLRHAVLRAGLPPESARFEGDDAATTLHLAAIEDEQVIGCVTVMRQAYEGAPAWRLRGMAVAASAQRRGVGGTLLQAVERRLRAMPGPRLIWCNARGPAVAFYERHGWAVVSEPFEVPTAGPHRRMMRRLA